jgi:DNA-binding response OmpR family regulator
VDKKKILLIEDEKNLARFMELELKHEQFTVTVVHEGKSGLELALGEEWDIILLDLMLPGLNGIEICSKVRKVKNTPIIMLTARDSITDRVSGLDSGADDYMPKPFAIEELLARMRSLLRRSSVSDQQHAFLAFRNIRVDLAARTVTKNGLLIEFTKREFDLLVMFLQNTNLVMTRDMLLDKVWGYDSRVETNVVDVYVRYVRNKIDSLNEESCIQTIRGIGYVMR